MTFVEIEEETYENLLAIARSIGLGSVEKLLTQVAKNFSIGCSVTLSTNI
jgi:hypothetical protein